MNTPALLGELPEPLRAWAKFRPADKLDFSRRAKSLATLLDLPLQNTQEAFAIACGYSGRHELQQILQQTGVGGPYSDDIPTEILDTVANAKELVRYYRDSRLTRAIEKLVENTPKRWSCNRDTTACDLELFSSPSKHRAAVKTVSEFIAGGSGCSVEGFPYGYRGIIQSRYQGVWRRTIDEGALADLISEWAENNRERHVFDPREQSRSLLRYRAPHLFVAMAEATAPDLLLDPSELLIDYDYLFAEGPSESELLLLVDVADLIVNSLCEQWSEEIDEEEGDRLLAAVRSPTPESVAASVVASATEDFAAKIPSWSVSLRHQIAKLLITLEGDSFDGEPGRIMQFQSFNRVADDVGRWLSICMQEQYIDLQQSHWKVSATLFTCDPHDGPWKAVALLTGDHFIATEEESYDGCESVVEYHEDTGATRYCEAWKLLSKLYLPVANYLSYHEWINNLWGGGGVVSILEPWVVSSHRGSDVSRWLFEEFVGAFDDGTAYCTDGEWQSWADPREDDDGMADLAPDDSMMLGPGVIFVPLPDSRTLGYSIWNNDGDTPTTKLLRLDGRRVGLRSRWGSDQSSLRGLGMRLLEVAKTVPADIVVYDPYDDGTDDETD